MPRSNHGGERAWISVFVAYLGDERCHRKMTECFPRRRPAQHRETVDTIAFFASLRSSRAFRLVLAIDRGLWVRAALCARRSRGIVEAVCQRRSPTSSAAAGALASQRLGG